jgi:hypothetical protein
MKVENRLAIAAERETEEAENVDQFRRRVKSLSWAWACA